MSDHQNIVIPEKSNDKKMILAMATIGTICAFLIVITYESTKSVIAENKAKALETAVFKALPGITSTKLFQYNTEKVFSPIASKRDINKLYAGYDDKGNFRGVAIQGVGKAYGDALSILFGYDPNQQKIIGFCVLESKETPGIGDKIEQEPFLQNFEGLDVALDDTQYFIKNEVITVKQGEKKNGWEIDGITGATITSRAVGNIINTSSKEWIPYIYKQKDVFISKNKIDQ